MRLDINLASQPYEDARQFWLRWGTALGAAAILTLALLTITITDWFAARRDHAQIAELRSEIAQRDRTREQAERFLSQPENRTTRDQSQFLNELIERKSLSWTHVLEDLEKVMPARVHLVSIHPELGGENQLTLKMVVAGDRDRALELTRRMEDSQHFTQTRRLTWIRKILRQRAVGMPLRSTSSGFTLPRRCPRQRRRRPPLRKLRHQRPQRRKPPHRKKILPNGARPDA
jgi:type IV pilus assembly protein PilN